MRAIFVNRFFAPDLSATSQMLTDLTRHMAALGDDIHVVCSRQLYENAKANLPRQEVLHDVIIHRAWSTQFGRAGLLGRAIDYLSFYVGAWWTLRSIVTPDSVVIAKTDPPLISVVVSQITRRRSAKMINWLQDLFPEVVSSIRPSMVQKGLGQYLYKLAIRVRNRSLAQAEANVVLGERMADVLREAGVAPERIIIVPNWSDADRVHPVAVDANLVRQEWNLHNKFVAMYSGNMGRAHEFDTFISAADLLKHDPRIIFLFVGGGAQKEFIAKRARELGLPNIRFKPYQPLEHLAESLSVGDIHLISLRPELEGLIVPSKFYGVLAAGRASVFVGDPNGELAKTVRMHEIGRVYEPGQAAALADGIIQYADNPQLCEAAGARARALFEMRFSMANSLKTWESILKIRESSS